MAVVPKDSIIQRINAIIPEGTEDMALLEDVADTFAYFENNSQTDYQTKYNDLMKKYRDRFIDGTNSMEDREEGNNGDKESYEQFEKRMTFDSLFERSV